MHTLTRFFRPTILWVLAFALAITSSCSKKEDAVPKSIEKSITGFSFASLTPAVAGTISGNSIAATVPFGTNLTLAPTIAVSAKATVSPASGSSQDFSKAVTYTVTAEDGSTQTYTVNVGVGAAPKSSAKDITAFAFNGLTPAVTGVIDATAKTISATLAAGTDATKLVPTVTVSAKATVAPASGAAQDFSKAVVYTVTAEDGTTQAYTVNLTVPKLTTVTYTCSGTIPEVWEDLGDGVDYIVKCYLQIGGNSGEVKTLTIKPGVRIQFEGGSSGFDVVGTGFLKMIGTAAKPIILEGKVTSAGSWRGVLLEANNLENQWEYVTLRHAGAVADHKGALKLYGYGSERISLKNCTFSDNTGYGIEVSDYLYGNSRFVAFESNTFTNNTKSAVRICQQQLGSLDAKSSYANNGQKYIEVAKGERSIDDIVVQKLDVPYRILQTIEPKAKTTINPGVRMEFTSDAGFFVSDSYKDAAFIANGTAADPIRFSGYLANTKGVWAGINVQSVSPETVFNYCIIDGAGSSVDPFFCVQKGSNAAIILGREYSCTPSTSRGTITNCTISNTTGYGISYRSTDPVTAKSNTFSGNTKADLYDFK